MQYTLIMQRAGAPQSKVNQYSVKADNYTIFAGFLTFYNYSETHGEVNVVSFRVDELETFYLFSEALTDSAFVTVRNVKVRPEDTVNNGGQLSEFAKGDGEVGESSFQ